jgi:hypothetical protein
VARGQANLIRLWDSDHPGNCSINQNNAWVTITGPGTFKLDAIVQGTSSVGTIAKLWIDPNATAVSGNVYVYVVRWPKDVGNDPHQPGCTQLKAVNLLNVTAGHVGNLVEVRMTGNAGATGKFQATNVTDNCVIGGNVLHSIEITHDILKPMSITGTLRASLACDTMHDLTIAGMGSGMFPAPNITIGQGYGHHMYVNQTLNTLSIGGDVDPNAIVEIAGYSSLYNLAMPSGVLRGAISVGDVLRKADLGGIAEDGSLSVVTQIGYDPNDHFHVTGDIAGTLTADSVYTDFEVDGAVTGGGSITVNQSFDTTTGNFPAAAIGGVDPNGLVQIGTLAGELNFTQPISGEIHIIDDLSGRLAAAEGITGSVQIQGDLSGALYAASDPVLAGSPALAGSLNVGGDVTVLGDIYAAGPIDAAVTIGGSLAGMLRTVADPNNPSYDPNNSLRGSLSIQNDLTGKVVLGGNLEDPADPNDPNASLLGHIIVNGAFMGQGGSNAAIIMKGQMAGWHPFIAVNYGLDPNAVWDPNTASVALAYPGGQLVTRNRPDLHIWQISACRGDANGDAGSSQPAAGFNLADADAFVVAVADAHAYAYEYPGLGALEEPWTTGGFRQIHSDMDCDSVVDFLDLNTFMIDTLDVTYDCYAPCVGHRADVPNQPVETTARELLENVADARCGALLTIEAQLADPNGIADPDVRVYWQAVLDYQTVPHVLPESLDFGGDPNATRLEFEILYAGSGALNGNTYSVEVEMYGTHRSEWLTVADPNGVFTSHRTLAATVARSALPTGEYSGRLLVHINGDPNATLEIPVTMTKPLTNPRIVPCLEYGGGPNDPNAYYNASAGLAQWQRVTNAAIIYNFGENVVPSAVYASLRNDFPDMTIYPGVVSNGGDACNLDDPNHWGDPNNPDSVVARVNGIAAASGSNVVFIDNENLFRKYLDEPGAEHSYYHCNVFDPNDFDPNAFAAAMQAFHQNVDPNIAIVWYPGLDTKCDADPNNWRLEWVTLHPSARFSEISAI